MTARLRSLLLPALCTLLAGALLVGLGVWQLHRLAWKDALIARIDARSAAPPAPLPPRATWAGLTPDGYEYGHVALTGTFDNRDETLILRASPDGPGYHVITPFRLSNGNGTVLVDRGFVPAAARDRASREAGELSDRVRITGRMRAPEARNVFTPADDPAHGIFYTRDPAKIAAYWHLQNAAPFTVDLDASAVPPGGLPKPTPVELAIPNNHLSYALTWFGLAIGLVGVFLSYAWARLSPARVRPAEHSTAAAR